MEILCATHSRWFRTKWGELSLVERIECSDILTELHSIHYLFTAGSTPTTTSRVETCGAMPWSVVEKHHIDTAARFMRWVFQNVVLKCSLGGSSLKRLTMNSKERSHVGSEHSACLRNCALTQVSKSRHSTLCDFSCALRNTADVHSFHWYSHWIGSSTERCCTLSSLHEISMFTRRTTRLFPRFHHDVVCGICIACRCLLVLFSEFHSRWWEHMRKRGSKDFPNEREQWYQFAH